MASTMRRLVAAAGFAFALLSGAQAQESGAGRNATTPAAALPPAATQEIRKEAPAASPSGLPVASPNGAPLVAPGGAPVVPEGYVAPPLPQPDDTNAERAQTQPRNNAPFWRGVRESGHDQGTVNNMPGGERGVLIQKFTEYPGTDFTSAGEAWRQIRNDWIIPYGGALLLITVLALVLFYWSKGTITVHEPKTGRLIERFTFFERAAHWINAIAFVLLAISGIFIAFGKFFILPIFGGTLFGWITYAMKNIHNFVGPAFAVSLVVMFFAYVRDNWPRKEDIAWLKKGGGLLTGQHVPSYKFNAGEKTVFWGGVVFLGTIVVASGFVLNKIVPGVDYTRGTMQVAHIVHAIATVLMMAMITAHAYLGSIGMEGAYRAMRDGYVDEAWAKDHHEYWYRDIKEGKIPAQRTPLPDQTERPAPQH